MEIIYTPERAHGLGAQAICPLGLLSRSPIGPDGLNVDSRISVDTAGYLHETGVRLIPSGNDRAGYPKAAQNFWRSEYPAINPIDYGDVDGNGLTTRDSANSLPALLGELGVGAAIIITAGYHVPRVQRAFDGDERIVGIVVAEDVLSHRSYKDLQSMDAFRISLGYRRQKLIEGGVNMMPWLEPFASSLVRRLRRLTLERNTQS